MKRNIGIYKGNEIDEEKLSKLKRIAASRYEKSIYDYYYSCIENVDELAYFHNISVNDEILILGEDWFLCYKISDSIVTFLEWVAIDNKESRMKQVIEMMNAFKNILIQNKDKQFVSYMRHDSSYKFYYAMIQRKYFKECMHLTEIAYCHETIPKEVKYLEDNYLCLEDFLNSNEALEHPEYLKYILHYLAFFVTDKFIDKYAKKRTNK